MKQGIVIPLVILLVAVISAIFIFQFKSNFNLNNKLSFGNKTGAEKLQNNCSSYGTINKDLYLNEYVVQDGDTLLKIANRELGDDSRVDELIQLNKGLYPSLSIQSPTIEVGWKLQILPKIFPKSTGSIEGISGEITNITDKEIVINLFSNKKAETVSYITPNTIYLGKDSFKIGNCVHIIKDSYGPAGTGILAVSPQDKNYFKDSTSIATNSGQTKAKCKNYGYLDKDFYLDKYTVQKRDSISQVAEKVLGDVTRTDELIQLNKTWYPHLSLQNPFIEIGWELRLPSKFISKSTGILVGIAGEILEINDKQISIDMNFNKVGFDPGSGYITNISKNIKYLGTNTFKVGDCVNLIEESAKDITVADYQHVIAISPQDKNYFK